MKQEFTKDFTADFVHRCHDMLPNVYVVLGIGGVFYVTAQEEVTRCEVW